MKFRIRGALILVSLLATTAPLMAIESFVYFGTHRSGSGIGFSRSRFDSETGALSPPEFLIDARSPAFFTLHPDGGVLYACTSGIPGGVAAYRIDPHTGRLALINRVLSGGGDASFVSLDRTARYALVANYQGGNIASFALRSDGGIGDWTGFAQHTGSSIHPQRQSRPFAHAIVTDPENRYVLVPDLGVDKLYVYRFDTTTGALAPNDPPSASVTPGSGPRHVRFHPNARWVYLINELASTVTAFTWDSAKGALAEFQTVSTLPADFQGTSHCAELEVHPNGKFLYTTNRGHDSLAVFAIDPATGRLSLVEHSASGGKTPRNFDFDPTHRWILCTNHDSNNAVVFRVDDTTGRLTQTGRPVTVPYPFCPRFLPVH